jgi:hypothetical protein
MHLVFSHNIGSKEVSTFLLHIEHEGIQQIKGNGLCNVHSGPCSAYDADPLPNLTFPPS